jgi:hypothetical protein
LAGLGALILMPGCGGSSSSPAAPAAATPPANNPAPVAASAAPAPAPAPAASVAATPAVASAAAPLTPVMVLLGAPDRYAGQMVTIAGSFSGSCCPSGNCASGVIIKDGLAGLTVMPPAGFAAPAAGTPVRATGTVRIYQIPGPDGRSRPFPVIEAVEVAQR